jgi:hypothetical protein
MTLVFNNLQSKYIKLKYTKNEIIVRNEYEINPTIIFNDTYFRNDVFLLLNQYQILKESIYTTMYAKNDYQDEDDELFLITKDAFYGITLDPCCPKEYCKYIVIRDNIRCKTILSFIYNYFKEDSIKSRLKSIIEPIQEIQYRTFDENYDWNIYFVVKKALLLKNHFEDLIYLLNYFYKENAFYIDKCKHILNFYLQNDAYKLSMIGISKKTDSTVSFKIFLSKSNLN